MSTVCKALLVAAFAATAVQSYGLDITAWKGETVNAFLPDGESVAAAKDGFEVKVGALKGVAYSQAPKIWRKETSNALDRVVWGDAAATSRIVQVKVPREWSEGGDCGVLRVSGVFVDCGSRQIAGAMGSHVYPTVQEGAFAITNGLHAAVVSASRGTARFFPLQKTKDGSGTIRYEWNVEDKELELTIRCFVNERRQMAVCTLLHVKGDGIGGGLADDGFAEMRR